MAKNKNILTNSDNRLIYVEPNCSDRGIPNPEDFSVFVSLTTTSKNRSTLTNGKVINTQGSSKPIGFIDGTNIGGGRRSLTTNYTEISTDFTQGGENDLETLGIESIDISFDTAYTPMIKIKFIDIRGNAVLSKGNDSRYKMFFDLPFPIFDLTVKGFYGKAVKYCLHLTKWNASFNSSTGNFEIDTEFIGYTYALLTDCLLGYMRAAALTTIGEKKFKKYQTQTISLTNKNPKYPNLISIDNLLKYIREIDSDFSKIKAKDENVKQLNVLDDFSSNLDNYLKQIDTLKKISIGGFGDLLNDKDDNIVLLDESIYNNNTASKNKSTLQINKHLENFKKVQENIESIINKPIGDDLALLKLEKKDIIPYIGTGFLANPTAGITKDEIRISPGSTSIAFPNATAKSLKEDIEKLYKVRTDKEKLALFSFSEIYGEVKRVEALAKIRKKELEDNLNNILKNAVNNLSFKPTIRNIVNVLCIHAQVFLETLAQVSKNAEESEDRKKAILKIDEFKASSNKNKNIYPWPEYRKNKSGILVESWIGASLTEDYNKVNEVVFVDELLQNLMKIARQDEIREVTGSLDSADFFPVSPAEANVEIENDSSLIKKNPYYQALKEEGTGGTPQEAIRCLLYRTFIAGGVSSRIPQLSGEHTKVIGELEAENLVNVLKTEFKNPILKDNIINTINNMGVGTTAIGIAKDATEEVIKTWKNGGPIAGVEHPPNSGGSFFSEAGDSYFYNYIRFTVTAKNIGSIAKKVSYIPISGGFNGKDFFNEDKTPKEQPELKKLSEDLIFTSNNISVNQYKVTPVPGGVSVYEQSGNPFASSYTDDGSFHFKILVDNDDEPSDFTAPIAQSAKLQEYKDKVGKDSILITYYPEIGGDSPLKSSTYLNQFPYEKDKGNLNYYNGLFNTLAINQYLKDPTSETEVRPVNELYFAPQSAFNQDYDDDEESTGFSLALEAPKGTAGGVNNFNSDKNYKINNEEYIGVYDSISTASITKTIGQGFNKSSLANRPGGEKSKIKWDNGENITRYIRGEGTSEIYAPFIDFAIRGDNKGDTLSLSLFGSLFYYHQDSMDGKAFLFLNSIGWTGIVGKDVSLFDLLDTIEDGKDDNSVNIKGLYGNSSSIMSVPKLWCAFIGSILYRSESRYDIINWSSKENIGGGAQGGKVGVGLMFPLQTKDTNFPKKDEYLHAFTDEDVTSGIFLDMSKGKNYPNIDEVIVTLPRGIKNEFIRIFNNFVANDYPEIAKEYELFKDVEDLKNKWLELSKNIGYDANRYNKSTKKNNLTGFQNKLTVTDEKELYNPGGANTTQLLPITVDVFKVRYYPNISELNLANGVVKMVKKSKYKAILGTNGENEKGKKFKEVLKNYDNVSPINDNEFQANFFLNSNFRAANTNQLPGQGDIGYILNPRQVINNFYQFDLTLAPNDNNRDLITSHIVKTYQVINATPMAFRGTKGHYIKNDSSKPFISGKEDYNKGGIRVKKDVFKSILQNFFLTFGKLTSDLKKDDDEVQQRIFNNVDDDIIKLNIYRTLASINDKWLGSETGLACTNIGDIVDSFRFLDTGFLDIGDDFLINPLSVSQKIISNYNQSFFDLINSILIENNFNFIALPSFIDFTTAEKMKEDVFTPYAWSENISDSAAGASFICVYTGQKSSNLDLGKGTEHEDDGFTVISDGKCDDATNTMAQPIVQPELFNKKKGQKGYNIPYFLVSYGKGNQSIFKDIKLDQREFTETAESLEIINDLSDAADKSKTSYKGQNLFNVYQKRAYSAEVEMMGNVTIQPMMYFQLNNIPMFKGAYLIHNTTHNITAHNMKTTFKGSRIKKVKTPLITEIQIFQTLIGSLKDGGKAKNITGGDSTFSGNITSTFQKSKFIKIS